MYPTLYGASRTCLMVYGDYGYALWAVPDCRFGLQLPVCVFTLFHSCSKLIDAVFEV